jgi:dTDP-4-dehydrorhamnose 3,5-epimerase
MRAIATAIPGVLVIEPELYEDARGFFMETFRDSEFRRLTGCDRSFVQDNHSRSAAGVLRGMHFQVRQPQGKLVRVVAGEVFDVAVDLRRGSPTFGRWVGERLSAANHRQLWIPEGFAHGFYVLDGPADTLYKATDYYSPGNERTLAWDDPTVGIAWPFAGMPFMAAKDTHGAPLAACAHEL